MSLFLVDLLYTNTYANCYIKVASQEAVDMFQEAVDVAVAVEVEEEAVELTWEWMVKVAPKIDVWLQHSI